MIKSLNFEVYFLESVSSSNISSLLKLYCQKFGKLFKTVLGIFISESTSAVKVLQVCVFLILKKQLQIVVESKLISVVVHSVIYHR